MTISLKKILKAQKTGIVALMAWAVAMALAACSETSSGDVDRSALPSEEEVMQMYNHYIQREYAVYVDQMESLDHKPEDYRKQMIDLMKQLRHRQDSIHGGPLSCRVMKFEPSADSKYCSVFLEVTFKDRSFEQILLPMVRKDDVWRLK